MVPEYLILEMHIAPEQREVGCGYATIPTLIGLLLGC
jgi:hypothetical protein